MNTHETYVSLETSTLLKRAGFDWETRMVYWYDYTISQRYILTAPATHDNWNNRKVENIDYISVPTLSVAQKWLREVHEMPINVIAYRDGKTNKVQGFCYQVYEKTMGWSQGYFTYESALEAGIKKCLEMILKEEKRQ